MTKTLQQMQSYSLLLFLAFLMFVPVFAYKHRKILIAPTQNLLTPLARTKKGYEVFGFAPYWTLQQLQNVDFNILTTFAFFSIDVTPEGHLDKTGNGYTAFKSAAATELFKKAHTSGTRVVATLTQMDNQTILTLLENPQAQAIAIAEIVDLVQKRGIDGVNIDFEYTGDPGSVTRSRFNLFVRNVTTALHKQVRSSQVTVSVYASAAKEAKMYDIASLSTSSDGIFMMAYDFATTGSDVVMPTDPLYGYKEGKYWYDISTAVKDFTALMPSGKLILGLPWYGYDYPVYTPQINAQTKPYWTWAGPARTETYSLASDEINPATIGSENYLTGWDSYGQVGYKAYYNPRYKSWRMVYMDDVRSMGIKYDFAKKENLAGVGIWAMGFDNGKTDLWNLLNLKFGIKYADSTVLQKKIDETQ